MSTNRQKSFLAMMSCQSYGLTMIEHPFDSDKKVLGQTNSTNPISLYFRCEGNHYIIYIRSEGPYYGKTINKEGHDLVAKPPAGRDTTCFRILDPKTLKTVTLDDLFYDPVIPVNVFLETTDGSPLGLLTDFSSHPSSVIQSGSLTPSMMHTDAPRKKITLHITERNVPYISNPSEI